MPEQDAYDKLRADHWIDSVKRSGLVQNVKRYRHRKLIDFLKDESVPWITRYNVYMKSSRWRNLKNRIKFKRGEMCERCGCGGHVQLHHLSYVRLGYEEDEDLKLLCKPCHDLMHLV